MGRVLLRLKEGGSIDLLISSMPPIVGPSSLDQQMMYLGSYQTRKRFMTVDTRVSTKYTSRYHAMMTCPEINDRLSTYDTNAPLCKVPGLLDATCRKLLYYAVDFRHPGGRPRSSGMTRGRHRAKTNPAHLSYARWSAK